MTSCVVPATQIVPLLGSVIWGVKTMSSLRLMTAAAGDAVTEDIRARAEKRAVKSCIVNVAEKTRGTTQIWGGGRERERKGVGWDEE